jgi:hypothetical protein
MELLGYVARKRKMLNILNIVARKPDGIERYSGRLRADTKLIFKCAYTSI